MGVRLLHNRGVRVEEAVGRLRVQRAVAVALVARPVIAVRQRVVDVLEAVRVGEPRSVVARLGVDSEVPLRTGASREDARTGEQATPRPGAWPESREEEGTGEQANTKAGRVSRRSDPPCRQNQSCTPRFAASSPCSSRCGATRRAILGPARANLMSPAGSCQCESAAARSSSLRETVYTGNRRYTTA